MSDDRLHEPISAKMLKTNPWRLVVTLGDEVFVLGYDDARMLHGLMGAMLEMHSPLTAAERAALAQQWVEFARGLPVKPVPLPVFSRSWHGAIRALGEGWEAYNIHKRGWERVTIPEDVVEELRQEQSTWLVAPRAPK